MKKDLVIDQSINVKASIQEAWHAWTDSDELENWWGENIILEAKVGGKFQEKWEDDTGTKQVASGKVLKLKKFEYIVFSWNEKGWPKNAETICEIRLEKKEKGCVIHLTHAGWDRLPQELTEKVFKDFKVGWNFHLKELKEYLDF